MPRLVTELPAATAILAVIRAATGEARAAALESGAAQGEAVESDAEVASTDIVTLRLS